jgi:hypothetical protein
MHRTEADVNARVIANERHLDWLLAETLGDRRPCDPLPAIRARLAGAPRSAEHERATSRWLAAALILFGCAVAVGVAWLTRADGRPQEPVQSPAPVLPVLPDGPWLEAHGAAGLNSLPADVKKLKCFDFGDDDLAGLARFTSLQALDLSLMDVDERGVAVALSLTGRGFTHLAGLKDLRWLSVHGCNQFTGEGLAQLENAPLLAHLDLSYTAVTADALARLHRLPSLRELSLADCGNFPGSALAEVAKCAGLRLLSLRGCYTLRGEDVRPLAQLRALSELDLGDCNGRFRGQVIGELPFGGDDIGLDDHAVRGLATLPLESLVLSRSEHVTDDGIAALAGMKSLRRLSLESLPRLTGSCLPALPRGIEALHLAHDDAVTREALLELAQRDALRELSLPVGPALSAEDLATLLGSLPLRALRLDGVVERDSKNMGASSGLLRAAGIAKVLARAESLEELQLTSLPCVDERVIAAAAGLPRLQALDLSMDLVLRDHDLRALRTARSLRSLRLFCCSQLTVRALVWVRTCPLRELDLCGTAVARPELEPLMVAWPGCEIVLANSAHLRVPAK